MYFCSILQGLTPDSPITLWKGRVGNDRAKSEFELRDSKEAWAKEKESVSMGRE